MATRSSGIPLKLENCSPYEDLNGGRHVVLGRMWRGSRFQGSVTARENLAGTAHRDMQHWQVRTMSSEYLNAATRP